MKIVLTLVCVLFVAHYAASTCTLIKNFDTTFVPACSPNDVYIKWPNYEDQTSYYTCYGVGTPVVTPCPIGQYFIFVLQECGDCQSYIPPVPCNQLKTQYPPTCVPMGNGTSTPGGNPSTPAGPSYPTPNYPETTTESTTKTTKSTASTPPTNSTATVPKPSTPSTGPSTQVTGFPGPETPATPAPNVPTPPTPPATPPNVEITPPTSSP